MRSIHGIKGLVEEQSNRPGEVHPRWAVGVQCRIIVEHGQKVDNDKAEAAEGDGIGRHRHREAFDDHVRVEWLQDVLGREGLVDACIFILVQLLQVSRPDIHHFDVFWFFARVEEVEEGQKATNSRDWDERRYKKRDRVQG